MAMMMMISEPRRPRAVRIDAAVSYTCRTQRGLRVYCTHGWAVQKRMNRSRCCLQTRVRPRNAVIDAVQIARARVARRDMCHRHSTVHARWPRAAHHSGYALRRCGPIPNYSGHLLLSCGRSAYVPRGGGKWTAVGATWGAVWGRPARERATSGAQFWRAPSTPRCRSARSAYTACAATSCASACPPLQPNIRSAARRQLKSYLLHTL